MIGNEWVLGPETSEWITPTLGEMRQDLLVTTPVHESAGDTALQIVGKVKSEAWEKEMGQD